MVVFAGQGDARRSMALLWRTPGAQDTRTGPGPKPALSVDMIVDAAIAVADAEGMAALSMRAVGERLGRTAMALYTYVPSKAELVDLMYDHVLAELPAGHEREAGWREAATAWAEEIWAFYLRHPWVLQVSQARPVLGPNEYAMLDTVVGILRRTGLEAGPLRRLVGALIHFMRGMARTAAESRQAAAATGVPDEEWWFARSALLAEVAPGFAERFPMVAWLESGPASPPEDQSTPYLEREARQTFQAGLAVLLDGVEAAVSRAGAGAGASAGGVAERLQ
ncbi:TetR/AcrR family transcriptional regulator C-terminal domain-containing protein [Sphaerisporangium perillae]|uniref:TetR/AcrR family transcriptional regulator C-terminal domain-containing protein n=1 Tax=Sphaerisporangium perillae TaxID=2935860 RepID=UPI00200EE992|nr:TetR/AcrR family transcriptional regulator C-terminal domain-containing protein [Sphaerisporangium perillae]